jgi:hypothetical protein
VKQQTLTDDWKVHLQTNKLKELEAIHVWHVDITDHKVKLAYVLPE